MLTSDLPGNYGARTSHNGSGSVLFQKPHIAPKNAGADCSRSGYHRCRLSTTEEVVANEIFVGPFCMRSRRVYIPRPDTLVKLMIFALRYGRKRRLNGRRNRVCICLRYTMSDLMHVHRSGQSQGLGGCRANGISSCIVEGRGKQSS